MRGAGKKELFTLKMRREISSKVESPLKCVFHSSPLANLFQMEELLKRELGLFLNSATDARLESKTLK